MDYRELTPRQFNELGMLARANAVLKLFDCELRVEYDVTGYGRIVAYKEDTKDVMA